MAVPPRPGTEVPSRSFEHDPRHDPPGVPRPLPSRSRRSAPAIAMVLAVLVVIALIVLL